MSTLVCTGGDLPNNKGEEKESFRFTVVHKESGAKNNIVVEGKNPDDCYDEMMNKINGTDLENWKDGEIKEEDLKEQKKIRDEFWDEFKVISVRQENKNN